MVHYTAFGIDIFMTECDSLEIGPGWYVHGQFIALVAE